MILAAVQQQQQIDVPGNSWVGHMSMAGIGIVLLVLSAWCIKGRKPKNAGPGVQGKPMGPWGPFIGSFGDRYIAQSSRRLVNKMAGRDPQDTDFEGLDWKSLMTFTLGVFGMTAILSSSPGPVLSFVQWAQDRLMGASDWWIISDVGPAGICFLLVFLAMKNRDDDMKDLIFGAACGFIWPLGGGIFAEMTFNAGQWIPQLLQIG